ncbi:MAG: J domain-containing protein [Microthrixaceae bacterium]
MATDNSQNERLASKSGTTWRCRDAPDAQIISEGGTVKAQDSDRPSGGDDGFPGGRPKLPRISRPHTLDRDEEFVERALHREPAASERAGNPDVDSFSSTGFGQYYSTQSLFSATPDPATSTGSNGGPYAVLGLTRHASWEQIRSAHRSLVSLLHPDRYVNADEEVKANAERRVRDVNEAFSEIRRQRASTSA